MTNSNNNLQSVESLKPIGSLSEELKTIYDALQEKFNNAGITDSVGVRIATILENDERTGRFLNANSDLSVDELRDLYTALGSPDPISVTPYRSHVLGVHANSTGEE